MWEMGRKRQFKKITAHLENLFLSSWQRNQHTVKTDALLNFYFFPAGISPLCHAPCEHMRWEYSGVPEISGEVSPAGNETVGWGEPDASRSTLSYFQKHARKQFVIHYNRISQKPMELSTVYCCLCPPQLAENLKCLKGLS